MKIVITGGPCTGKTTLIERLKIKGYKVIEEVARDVINEEQAKGSDVLPKDFVKFQYTVIKKQLSLERGLSDEEIVFLDRSPLDCWGYYKQRGLEPSDEIKGMMNNLNYDLIIYLEPLSHYEDDDVRSEGREVQLEICNHLKESYEDSGMKMICLPEYYEKKRKNIKKRLKVIECLIKDYEKGF